MATIDDLQTIRGRLEAAADQFDQEHRRYEAAAESARYDRDRVDGQVDRISAVLGDRDVPNWLLRRRLQGDPDYPPAECAGAGMSPAGRGDGGRGGSATAR